MKVKILSITEKPSKFYGGSVNYHFGLSGGLTLVISERTPARIASLCKQAKIRLYRHGNINLDKLIGRTIKVETYTVVRLPNE